MSLKMLKRLTKTIKTTRWTVKNADRNSFCWTIQRYCEALEEFVLRGRFKKKRFKLLFGGFYKCPLPQDIKKEFPDQTIVNPQDWKIAGKK